MSRMSWLTRTDQKPLSLAFASLWKLIPGLAAGLIWRSNAVVLTAFCSSPVSRARLSVKVSAILKSIGSGHPEHLHHLVAEVVDDLHGDAARSGLVEGTRRVAVQGGPGRLVDLGLERGLQRAVGVVRPQEVGVADEEALLVVVGVDEPAGDAVGPVTAHFAAGGVEDVHAVDLQPHATALAGENGDVRLPENHEEVSLAGVLEVLGHVQVGIH